LTTCSRADATADINYPFLTQKERDVETGLDYFINRYYSSTEGRFTSSDPLLASARPSSPQSWNRYSYVLNNPVRLVDPDGRKDTDDLDEQEAKRRLAAEPTHGVIVDSAPV